MTARRSFRHNGPDTADRTTWRDQAACAGLAYSWEDGNGEGADPWFPTPNRNGMDAYATARAICATCPVSSECLDYALTHDIRYGMFGGLSANERRSLGSPPHDAATGKVGARGYRQGCRCWECVDYNTRTVAAWKARQREAAS